MACYFKMSLALTENSLLLSSMNKGWWDFIILSKYCVSSTSESIQCDFVRSAFPCSQRRQFCAVSNQHQVLGMRWLLITTWTVSRIPENLESVWNAVPTWLCCAVSLSLDSFMWLYGEAPQTDVLKIYILAINYLFMVCCYQTTLATAVEREEYSCILRNS